MGEGTYRLQFNFGILLFAVPLAFGFFQWMPLGEAVSSLCPAIAQYWAKASALWGARSASLSLYPDATMRRCGLYLGCLILFLLIGSLARHRRYMIAVLCAVAVAALGNAARFYVQVFSDAAAEGRSLTGTFFNRNHFGFMMTLGIMAVSGLLAISATKNRHHVYDFRNRALDRERSQGVLFLLTFLLLFLVVAQALCLSRGAFLTSTFGLMAFWSVWVLHYFRHDRQKIGADAKNRQTMLVLAILFGGALCVAMPWILEALSERYAELLTVDGLNGEGRLKVWSISMKLFRQYGIWGVGLGGYGVAVQPLENGVFPQALIVHAHNDYLELACEIGLPMAIILFALGGWLWCRWMHVVRRQHDFVYHWAGMAALVALASCAAHEFVEYSLLTWPNAFAFTAMMAVASACFGVQRGTGKKSAASVVPTPSGDDAVFVDPEEAEQKLRSEERHSHHENFRRNRWRYRLGYLAFAILLLVVNYPPLLRDLNSGIHATRLLHGYEELQAEDTAFHWGKSSQDYRRLLAFADRALRHWNSSRPKMLAVRAEVRQQLAVMLEDEAGSQPSSLKQVGENLEEAVRLRQLALADLKETCSRVPGYGDYVFQYAKVLESGQTAPDWKNVLAYYDWGLSRQPGIADSIRTTSDAYARAWLWAIQNRQVQEALDYRQHAIDGYLHSLDLHYSQKVLVALRLLQVPLEELLAHVKPGKNQQQFFESLMDSQDYSAAEILLDAMAGSFPEPEEISAEEWTMQVAKDKVFLAEMNGNLDGRRKAWMDYQAKSAIWQSMRLATHQELLDAGKDWEAEELLRSLEQEKIQIPQITLCRARQLKLLGRPADVVLALLPLAYSLQNCPSQNELQDALELLAGMRGAISANSPVALRYEFLLNALVIRKNSEAESVDHEEMVNAVARLEQLYAIQQDKNAARWLQEHLIAFYAGRGQEALGNLDQACMDYRMALARCPNFLPGIQRLAQIRNEELNPAEQKLLELQRRVDCPIGIVSNGMVWMDVESSRETIQELYETSQCTFVLLCTGDLNYSQEWQVAFRDRRGVVFHKKLIDKSMGAKFLTMRVGEVMLLPMQLHPNVDVTGWARRKLVDGELTAECGGCRANVLKLDLE